MDDDLPCRRTPGSAGKGGLTWPSKLRHLVSGSLRLPAARWHSPTAIRRRAFDNGPQGDRLREATLHGLIELSFQRFVDLVRNS